MTFNANCQLRAADCVPVIRPKFVSVGVVFGALKLTWLNRLNASARKLALTRSVMLNFLLSEKSQRCWSSARRPLNRRGKVREAGGREVRCGQLGLGRVREGGAETAG